MLEQSEIHQMPNQIPQSAHQSYNHSITNGIMPVLNESDVSSGHILVQSNATETMGMGAYTGTAAGHSPIETTATSIPMPVTGATRPLEPDYSRLTNKELKEMLRAKGLKVSGKKEELMERLRNGESDGPPEVKRRKKDDSNDVHGPGSLQILGLEDLDAYDEEEEYEYEGDEEGEHSEEKKKMRSDRWQEYVTIHGTVCAFPSCNKVAYEAEPCGPECFTVFYCGDKCRCAHWANGHKQVCPLFYP